MKVRDLLALLQSAPPDRLVVLEGCDCKAECVGYSLINQYPTDTYDVESREIRVDAVVLRRENGDMDDDKVPVVS